MSHTIYQHSNPHHTLVSLRISTPVIFNATLQDYYSSVLQVVELMYKTN